MINSRRRITKIIADKLLSGENQAHVINQLAAYLVTHKLTAQVDRFIADIEQHLASSGVVVADITTASPLTDDLRTSIGQFVASKNQTVELREHLDKSLIGGIIIATPTSQLDASISSKLRRLTTTL